LGYHVGKLAFKPLTSIAKLDHEELFNLLKEFWYPHSQAVEAEFTRHAVELNRIVMEIKNDEDFKFMDYHIYPEWERLVQKKENTVQRPNLIQRPIMPRQSTSGFHPTPDKLEKGFICVT